MAMFFVSTKRLFFCCYFCYLNLLNQPQGEIRAGHLILRGREDLDQYHPNIANSAGKLYMQKKKVHRERKQRNILLTNEQ